MEEERPILFSAAMIDLIMAGSKSQTRRVVKPQFEQLWGQGVRHGDNAYSAHVGIKAADGTWDWLMCPYGKPGDCLWVRESFWWGHAPNDELDQGVVMYDDGSTLAHPALLPERRSWARQWRRKPAMYMPRWASRITLEVVSMRVEPLQDIWHKPPDLLAEGITPHYGDGCDMLDEARDLFVELWDRINAKRGYPWSSSPWVWVITFRRIQPRDRPWTVRGGGSDICRSCVAGATDRMIAMSDYYWHFCRVDGDGVPRLSHGDGREVRVGETLTVNGEPELCEYGLHASRRVLDALQYAPSGRLALCRVTLGGTVLHDDDRSVATERTAIAMLDAAKTDALLRAFTRWCALGVAHLWDTPDVVRRYLETGDETLRDAAWDAARYAARAAAWDAARYAARAAAWDAARYAAWAAQNEHFGKMALTASQPQPGQEGDR